jgi:hypothetical protein
MAWLLNPSMLEFLILAAIAFAGYAGGSGWLALAGAVALTIGGWWRKVQPMRQAPQVPFSSKMTTYLIVSVGINLGFAAASLIAGRAARYLLGG